MARYGRLPCIVIPRRAALDPGAPPGCVRCHSSSSRCASANAPGLDQQALSFIAVSTPAEANHHGVPWTFRLGSTREQRISGGQEFKITETGVSRACRARIFYDEKI